ncbi:unnamed protein product [Strongylus vulgaris]|uniref:Uncharacterized protein n=1 Tax=Strongylus vulgaris TaxID=40348 RepID=A0A3P7IHH1_STRVU|nr:unnamed protein product [Strongylus vulgaris]
MKKRQVSQFNSVHDPIGLAAVLSVKLKSLMRKITLNIDWKVVPDVLCKLCCMQRSIEQRLAYFDAGITHYLVIRLFGLFQTLVKWPSQAFILGTNGSIRSMDWLAVKRD